MSGIIGPFGAPLELVARLSGVIAKAAPTVTDMNEEEKTKANDKIADIVLPNIPEGSEKEKAEGRFMREVLAFAEEPRKAKKITKNNGDIIYDIIEETNLGEFTVLTHKVLTTHKSGDNKYRENQYTYKMINDKPLLKEVASYYLGKESSKTEFRQISTPTEVVPWPNCKFTYDNFNEDGSVKEPGGGEEGGEIKKATTILNSNELNQALSIEGNISVKPAEQKQDGKVTVKFTIKNTSDKKIDQKLPVYLKFANDMGLSAFQQPKITLEADGTQEVCFELNLAKANKQPGNYQLEAGIKGTEVFALADLTILPAESKKDPSKTGEASPVGDIIDVSKSTLTVPSEAVQGAEVTAKLNVKLKNKKEIPEGGYWVEIKLDGEKVRRVKITKDDVGKDKEIKFYIPDNQPKGVANVTANIGNEQIADGGDILIKARETDGAGAPTATSPLAEPTGDPNNRASFDVAIEYVKSDKKGAPKLADPPEVQPEGKVYVRVTVKNTGGRIIKKTPVPIDIYIKQDGNLIPVPVSPTVEFDGISQEATSREIKVPLSSDVKPGSARVDAYINAKYKANEVYSYSGNPIWNRPVPQATEKDNIASTPEFKISKDAGLAEFVQYARYDDPTLGVKLLPIMVKMPNLGIAGSSKFGGFYDRTDPKDDTVDWHKGMYYHKNPMGVLGSATNESLRDYAVDNLLKSSAQTGFSFTGDTEKPQFVQEIVNTSLTKKTINRLWSVQCKDEDGNEYVAYIHTDITVPKNANAPFVLYDHNIELHMVQVFNKKKETAEKGTGTISNTDFDKACKSLRDTHDKMSVPKPELPKPAATADDKKKAA